MQAYMRGDIIQVKRIDDGENKYKDIPINYDPGWNFQAYDYRIKPKEIYVNVYSTDTSNYSYGRIYTSNTEAISLVSNSRKYIRTAKFIEV